MAIKARGSDTEYAFIMFRGPGRVDAMNLETGDIFRNVSISKFKAGGGTNEIVREIKILQDTFNKIKVEKILKK
jgi:hypothetical protein